MSIVRFNPLSEVLNLQREMNKLFETVSSSPRRSDAEEFESAVWRPVVDVHEDENSYMIDIELPGLTREDLKINFQENTLAISGERRYQRDGGNKQNAEGSQQQNAQATRQEANGQGTDGAANGGQKGEAGTKVEVQSKKKSVSAHRVERFYGRFFRSFAFPTAVNAEGITARFENGVLEVTVPKAEEVKPRQITIS
jgi:HSP20 family protein